MNADPELKRHLARAADPLEPDVEERLRALHRSAPRRRLAHKAVVIAVAASVAILGPGLVLLAPGSEDPRVGSGVLGVSGSGEPSGPRGQIAYSRDVERELSSKIDLFTVDAAGGSVPIPIDTGPQNAGLARWSPDGSRIAYLGGDETTPYPYYSIVVANADGSDTRTIVHGQYFWLSWSPDGAQIAYVGETLNVTDQTVTQEGLWVVNADGTDARLILDGAWGSVDWSPDGTKLLLTGNPTNPSEPSGTTDIFTVTPQGSDLTRLTKDVLFQYAASWSPDGMSILFSESPTFDDADPEMKVVVATADFGDMTELTDSAGFDGFPIWSPDGAWIAFASDRDATPAQLEANASGGPYAGFSLYTMRVDGSDVSRVVDGGDAAAVWLVSSWKA